MYIYIHIYIYIYIKCQIIVPVMGELKQGKQSMKSEEWDHSFFLR
jgi:cytochrome b subunit of formate dehydrogenase